MGWGQVSGVRSTRLKLRLTPRYDNPLPEEEEPTRQELLEVLSHMRRDKGNDGPDTFSNKPDMPNSGGNGFRGSRRDTSGKFEDSPNSRQFGNDEGWTSTNKGDSRGPFGGGGEQNQGGWAGNGDIKDADQGHQNGWDPKKDHPSTVNDLTPPNGDNDGWGDGAKPADNGWNKQPDTKPEPNGWDDSKSIITDTITSNDWNTPLHRPKTQQSSSDTRNQAWSFERGEATVSPGNGATSPAGVHPDRLRMLGGMPRTNDIGPIRNDQPKAIPASPIANSGVDNGWAGRQARTQVVHNNTANQGFGGRGHGGHGGHGGDARGFDPEHQGFGGGDGGRGIGGYNNGPRNVESGQRQPWGSRQVSVAFGSSGFLLIHRMVKLIRVPIIGTRRDKDRHLDPSAELIKVVLGDPLQLNRPLIRLFPKAPFRTIKPR